MEPEKRNLLIWVFLLLSGGWLVTSVSSCGKAGNATPQGLNIQYHVVNVSPDIYPVDLFINNGVVNSSPFIFGADQGYFYVSSTNLPYQIRSAVNTGTTLFTLQNVLVSGAKYTLYITGAVTDGSDTTLFTVDTSASPPLGMGTLRFVNVSPSAIGGLDLYANGTKAFKAATGYLKMSALLNLPVGSYDFQIDAPGTTTVLHDMPGITIQDGRLYTLYAYGYTSRVDTAAFTAQITTNR